MSPSWYPRLSSALRSRSAWCCCNARRTTFAATGRRDGRPVVGTVRTHAEEGSAAGPIGESKGDDDGRLAERQPAPLAGALLGRRFRMRHYDRPLEVGEEITDGGERYCIVRVQERETRGGFGHAWAERREHVPQHGTSATLAAMSETITVCPYCEKPVDPEAEGVVYAVEQPDMPGSPGSTTSLMASARSSIPIARRRPSTTWCSSGRADTGWRRRVPATASHRFSERQARPDS